MVQINFEGAEYQSDGSFSTTAYTFKGDQETGWDILRENRLHMKLGPGYVPVETRYCGVCSTDLARRYLPHPLPQITGHEVVGRLHDQWVVVEINGSHLARNQASHCTFCKWGLANHCPDRITLGINRLPGGFAPWLLAPCNSIVPIPAGVDPLTASLVEPLAAAFQAVEVTAPRNGDRVAVLGPRRLGMLILPALRQFREVHGLDFEITALARHAPLLDLAARVGADQRVNLTADGKPEPFDIVFDTTGSPDGFELALSLAKRVLHLKSTHGREVMGMEHLSDMVVDELALLPYSPQHLQFAWPSLPWVNHHVFISETVSENIVHEISATRQTHIMSIPKAWSTLSQSAEPLANARLPRFDLAVVSSLEEVDAVTRPVQGASLVRPGGAILLADGKRTGSALEAALARGLQVHTSRCGNFRKALAVLEHQPRISSVLVEEMITQQFPLAQIGQAFEIAADSRKSIKVIVSPSHKPHGIPSSSESGF